MKNQDEYIVKIFSNGSRYYFKNGLLHRENGPAIVSHLDKDKYFELNDSSLYMLNNIEPYIESFNSKSEATYLEEDNLWEYPISLSIRTSYFINGIEYSQKEFEARNLKKELSVELPITEIEEKRTKV